MLKRILVALDPDADTPVATRHALRTAQPQNASVTGLAVVSTPGLTGTESHEFSIGETYYTNPAQQNLTSEVQKTANRLLSDFEAAAERSGVPYEKRMRQGVPSQRIISEMRFHDLLVIGEIPHYSYSEPEQQTRTLARVVRDAQAPTLVVREKREPPIERVIVAFDGGKSSVRALQAFAQLCPFGDEVAITLLHVHDELPDASERLLAEASAYLSAHSLEARTTSVQGRHPHEVINAHVKKTDADVVVAGARSVSHLRWLTFGSNTAPLLENCPAALFLHH